MASSNGANSHGKESSAFATRLGSKLLRGLAVAMVMGLAACSTSETLQTAVPQAASIPTLPSSKYAAIVVDANSGQVLYSADPDTPRYPASLTKMMTLYLLFEAMKSGKVTPTTEIPISAYAAARPPSKLGFKPGQTIDCDVAIRALVTKSANDVAVAVAEYLGGSEDQFAMIMTAKAKELGMRGTVFRNASGLPDPDQRTTARDMAVLGISLRRHFPSEYAYFSARSFAYRGKIVKGHNRVLERVRGADGIKTGYTRASGFNLVTSVERDGRRVVGVVMGGDTAKMRDDQMVLLMESYIPAASRR